MSILAVSAASVVAHVVAYPAGTMARAMSVRWLRWVGARSYGLYLWHGAIATYLYAPRYGATTRFGWLGYLAGICLAFVLAELSWRMVESADARRRLVSAFKRLLFVGQMWTSVATRPGVSSGGALSALVGEDAVRVVDAVDALE